MSNRRQIDNIKEQVKNKFEYLTDADIDTCYNCALSDYLLIKYPSDNNRIKAENVVLDFVTSQWIYERMIDILDRAGTNVISYSENNLKYTYSSSNIDPQLVAKILPKASVPK